MKSKHQSKRDPKQKQPRILRIVLGLIITTQVILVLLYVSAMYGIESQMRYSGESDFKTMLSSRYVPLPVSYPESNVYIPQAKVQAEYDKNISNNIRIDVMSLSDGATTVNVVNSQSLMNYQIGKCISDASLVVYDESNKDLAAPDAVAKWRLADGRYAEVNIPKDCDRSPGSINQKDLIEYLKTFDSY